MGMYVYFSNKQIKFFLKDCTSKTFFVIALALGETGKKYLTKYWKNNCCSSKIYQRIITG